MSRPPPANPPDDPDHGDGSTLPPSLPLDMPAWGDADSADSALARGPAATFSDPPEGRHDNAPPTIGHIGRYALKHLLGEGGIGSVYAAHDPLLSRQIAVKTLHLELPETERESFNALFLNEARAAAGLSHPHIVTVFDAGISDDRAYIAMEQLRGRDLRQLRQEGWRATPAQAALIVRRVADALGYAHSKGVVHRDVKPANIFMVGRTQPKVLDFGIARIAHQHQHQHQYQHEAQAPGRDIAAGSPYYMAPEQVRQETVDRRADVFSLGVVLYELLTDLKPFRGSTLDEITTAVLTHEPPLASTVDPTVPLALAEIAAKALAKDPDHRYRSARALSRELRHWLDDNTVAGSGDSELRPTGRGRQPLALALGSAGVVLLGALAWAVLAPGPALGPATRPTLAAATPASDVTTGAGNDLMSAAVAGPTSPEPPAAAAATAISSGPAPALDVIAPVVPAANAAAAVTAPPRQTTPRAPLQRPAPAALREREARTGAATTVVAPATGLVRIAISPWGEVEVNGKAAGTSPPLTELRLPVGRHQLVVRNSDLPAHSASLNVSAEQTVSFKHKF